MKNKIFIMSVLIAILLLGFCVYFTINYKSKSINPKIQNEECIDSKDIKNNNIDKSASPLTMDDFVIKDEYNFIKLGDEYKNLKTNEKITGSSLANKNVAYDFYIYENFEIYTSTSIFEIDLITSKLQTSRGIKIGDPITDVFKKYGDTNDIGKSISNVQYYRYKYEQRNITFYVESEKVSSITYDYSL